MSATKCYKILQVKKNIKPSNNVQTILLPYTNKAIVPCPARPLRPPFEWQLAFHVRLPPCKVSQALSSDRAVQAVQLQLQHAAMSKIPKTSNCNILQLKCLKYSKMTGGFGNQCQPQGTSGARLPKVGSSRLARHFQALTVQAVTSSEGAEKYKNKMMPTAFPIFPCKVLCFNFVLIISHQKRIYLTESVPLAHMHHVLSG